MFALGFLLSLPLLALFTHSLSGDSDSARLVASIEYVQHQDWRYLIHTQENYLPHLVLGPILAIGGVAAIKLFTVFTVQVLAGVISFLAWKLTGSRVAALGSALALLSFHAITVRTALLPMYPAMLALGFMGTYLAYRSVTEDGSRRWIPAVLAGLCLALSPEAHPVGQVFLLVPVLLAVSLGVRRTVARLVPVYLAMAVFALPRAVINLSEGGLSHVLSYRVDFWITKGYLSQIQERFFGYPVRLSYLEYVGRFIRRGPLIGGRLGVVILLGGVLSLLLVRGRVRRFQILAGGYFLALLLVTRAPFASRYYSSLLVGAALSVGLVIGALIARRMRGMTVGAVAVLVVLASINLAVTRSDVRDREASVLQGPYRELAARITDGKGVIGARSVYLLFADPKIRTYGTQFLSEKEYATYLTWPTDEAVIRILRAHDIGWILVMDRRWEYRYNDTWLFPAYGTHPRQVSSVATSPSFCLALRAGKFRLYRLGCSPP